MLTLALECSTALGSVALVSGRAPHDLRFLWREQFSAGRGEGGKLFTALANAMQAIRESGLLLEEIVVGLGPGSYSGVRQVIAAGTGLALATGARLTGWPSTAALSDAPGRYQAVGDARRGTFYYTAVQDGACIVGPELLPDLAALQVRLAEHADWPLLAVETVPPGLPSETTVALPLADGLVCSEVGRRVPPPLEPIYLRPVTFTLPKPKPAA